MTRRAPVPPALREGFVDLPTNARDCRPSIRACRPARALSAAVDGWPRASPSRTARAEGGQQAMMHVTDRRQLGKSGVEVPVIGFGGAPLGNLFQQFSDEQARATVRAAYDAGMRLFDTAPLYGHGLSEHRIGEALRWLDRDSYVLSTKVGRLLQPARPEDGRWQAVQAGPAVRGRLRLFLRCRDALGRRQPAAPGHAPDRRAADPRRRRLDPWQRGRPARAVQGGDGGRLPRAAASCARRAWSGPSAPGSTRSRPARSSPAPATSTASCWPAATRCSSRRP